MKSRNRLSLVLLFMLFNSVACSNFMTSPTVTPTTIPTNTAVPTNTFTPEPPTSTPKPTATEMPPTATPYPEEISDIDPVGNGILLRLVPAGDFTMGSENKNDEKPIRQIYLDAFYMDKYEVTNARYAACVDSGACTPPRSERSYIYASYYGDTEFDNYPVMFVDWHQAKVYCEWRGADLPTEAQWEKSARGTDARTYPWGEGIDCNRANYTSSCVGDTSEAGSYESGKSPYGIYDLAGNVWEWVDDWYDAYPGSTIGISDYGTTHKVPRGGFWYGDEIDARSAERSGLSPEIYNYGFLGFRCARSP